MQKTILILIGLVITTILKAQTIDYQETSSFYPEEEYLKNENIEWGYVTVPENWNDPDGKIITIAVVQIKNTSEKPNADAIVHIPGGPGGSGISGIDFWLEHPLRTSHDIVLFDVRGTGFSEPRLCPDLGNQIFEILAKNQSKFLDEKEKVEVAVSCRTKLESEGINVSSYNSNSIAKDISELKKQLGYTEWHVYGVSYGTYIAQIYANEYPGEVKSLILDSSVSNIETYYTYNTKGYMRSLEELFRQCKNNPDCNASYPKLEQVFYQVISDLENNPITVKANVESLNSESFTYNIEDFKIAIQQSLYDENLIKLVPLLIYEFHNRNKEVLSTLVTAFSGGFTMDYGVYFSVTCNEILPFNSLSEYQKDASKFGDLKGGIAFYESDFKVCEKWNGTFSNSFLTPEKLNNLWQNPLPVLIFSGGFDPITPFKNGKELSLKFKNCFLVHFPTYGHAPSFTKNGQQVVADFINKPTDKPATEIQNMSKVRFENNISINPGILNLGNSFSQPDFYFIFPIVLALLILISFIFIYTFKLASKKYFTSTDKRIRLFALLTSLVGVLSLTGLIVAIIKVANQNFFILVFGIPKSYNFLFSGLLIFMAVLVFTIGYFGIYFRKIQNRSHVFLVLFSCILLGAYLFYWRLI